MKKKYIFLLLLCDEKHTNRGALKIATDWDAHAMGFVEQVLLELKFMRKSKAKEKLEEIQSYSAPP